MTSKSEKTAEEQPQTEFESAAFFTDGFVETTLPAELVDVLDLSADQAALMYPTWNVEDLEVGMHIEFAEEAGPGVSGRQLKHNPVNDSLSMRFPAALSRLTGLERHVDDTKTRMHYDVDLEDETIELTFDPSLTPATTGDSEHPNLEERFKDSGFSPSRSSSGYLDSIRYEVPVDYAREYGFEPQKPVGLKLVVVDGAFGIAIDLHPNTDDQHLATRTMNSYSDKGPRKDVYAITVPKVAVHALRWTLDMAVKSIPQKNHIILQPANPIGLVDGTVADEEVIEAFTQGVETASV